jgi:hypothetical protein
LRDWKKFRPRFGDVNGPRGPVEKACPDLPLQFFDHQAETRLSNGDFFCGSGETAEPRRRQESPKLPRCHIHFSFPSIHLI